jgi:anti-sigma regulatory factor (Ser/Thr protein kinase)
VDLDVLAVVEEALLPVTFLAEEAGLALVVRPAADLVVARRGDPYRLRQIVLNLAANAVKFTERGSVTVTVGGTADRLVIRIADTGIGMSPEQLARLFTPFSQADASTTRRFGGTGLGLAIAGGLARQMGGDIAVQSSLGLGSSFELDVPLPAAHGEGRSGRQCPGTARGHPRTARPDRGGQRGQPAGGPGDPHPARRRRRHRRRRRAGGARGAHRELRRGADGLPDARHGRPGGDPADPDRPAGVRPAADHRNDGQRAGLRPGACRLAGMDASCPSRGRRSS